jgi:TfoX/Sxy family transcriptional regulator of competence genes
MTRVLPSDPGNLAAFVNGNMFAGLYENDFFVRLSEEESKELLKHEGAPLFEPMKGRPMKGYFLIPRSWKKQPDLIRSWMTRSQSWTSKMPPKKKTR